MKYLLVDAKNTLWRAASVMQLSGGGFKTGGTFGFMKMLLRAHDELGGKVIICWDDWEKGPAVRKSMYADYKLRNYDAERKALVEEITAQAVDLRTLLACLGVRQTRAVGWEADDVMATLARKLTKDHSNNVVIYTGDKDLFQCITGFVTVARPRTNGNIDEYNSNLFTSEFGIPVQQYVDYKALVGDDSDNIPGCKGVGPVAAVAMLRAYPSVESILHAAPATRVWTELNLTPRWANLVQASKENIVLSKKLAKVNDNVELRSRIGYPDDKAAKKILSKYQMSSLLLQFARLKELRWG